MRFSAVGLQPKSGVESGLGCRKGGRSAIDSLEVTVIVHPGEEAIGLLNANRYHVLIIDVAFGRDQVKGWAVARRARAFNSTLPVIYITGGNPDEWSIQGVPNSILLRKPFAPAQLLIAVSQLLNTGSSSVPRFA